MDRRVRTNPFLSEQEDPEATSDDGLPESPSDCNDSKPTAAPPPKKRSLSNSIQFHFPFFFSFYKKYTHTHTYFNFNFNLTVFVFVWGFFLDTYSRRGVQKRVVSVPITDVEGSKSKGEAYPPSDSWAWRKYGQKPIKGSPYPRYNDTQGHFRQFWVLFFFSYIEKDDY